MLIDRRSGTVETVCISAIVALLMGGCAHSTDPVDRELELLRAKFAALERVHVPRYVVGPGYQAGRTPTAVTRATPIQAPARSPREIGFPVRETHPQAMPRIEPTPRLPIVRIDPINSDPFAGGQEPQIRIGKRGHLAPPAERQMPRSLEYARLDAYGNLVDQDGKIIYRAGQNTAVGDPDSYGRSAFDDPHESPERKVARTMGPPTFQDPNAPKHSAVPKAITGRHMRALGLDVRDEPPINVRPTPVLRRQPREIKITPITPITPIKAMKKTTIVPEGLSVEPAVTVGDPTRAPGPNRLVKQGLYKGAKERAAQKLYKQAREKFVAQKYTPASKLLKQFLKRYFDHDLADNALYWLGETAYVQSNWLQSLSWFQDVIIRYPEGNKLAAAMLKSALCYAQMGDKAYAVKVLTDVETLFPSERVAQIARTRRLALSDGGR